MTQRVYGLFFLLLVTMILAACAGGDSADDVVISTEYLNVSSLVTVKGDGSGKGILDISADCGWTVSGAPSWMNLSANSGSKDAVVEITCTKNPSSTDERSAVLTVTSGSGKIRRSVKVIQSVSEGTISLNTSELSFISDGESKTLAILSNTSWVISGGEDWLTLNQTEGEGNSEITITAKKNTTSARQAILIVYGANTSVQVSVSQEAHIATFDVSPTVINAGALPDTYELILEGDAAWTASVNVDWCTLSKLSGTAGEDISVNVKENKSKSERTATITFSTNLGNKTCEVKQSGAVVPVVTGFAVSDIQRYSFKASVSYSSEYDVTECGVCYSVSNAMPSISDVVEKTVVTGNTGNVSLTIEGLQSGKTYYVRAYAKSAVGIGYSEVITIKTPGAIPGSGDNVTPQL